MADSIPYEMEVEGIGKVSFRRHPRTTRLSIRIKPLEGVQVLMPPHGTVNEALDFVRLKRDWIVQGLHQMARHEAGQTLFDEQSEFKTRSFQLKIEKADRSDVRLFLHDGVLLVQYPQHLPVQHPPIQEAIRYGIEEALRKAAQRHLPTRLQQLAQQYGFIYQGVFIKNLKSRWGSCSGVNNINLNLHLMRLPEALIDYVLLHELCHTREKNHGPRFWALLDRCTGGQARQLDKAMKDYRTRIY